jgi:hypothetical protein
MIASELCTRVSLYNPPYLAYFSSENEVKGREKAGHQLRHNFHAAFAKRDAFFSMQARLVLLNDRTIRVLNVFKRR